MAEQTLQVALDAASRHHGAGRLAQAEALYRQVLAQQPDHAEALRLLGLLAHQLNRNDAAAELIGRSIALAPDVPEAHLHLGIVRNAQERFDEAVKCYRRAIALRPGFAEAHNNLGNTLRRQGVFDESVACLRRAAVLLPQSAEVHNNLGKSLWHAGQTDEAAAGYRRALELRPDFAEAHHNLGVALAGGRRFDDAIECYRRAIALRPDYAEAYNNLGAARWGQDRLDEAIRCYQQAFKLDPGFAEAAHHLAIAARWRGEPEEAVVWATRALALKPRLANAHNSLGNALKDLGRLDEAIASYRQAAEIAHGDARADTNAIYTLQFHPAYNAEAILEAHRRWEARYASPLAAELGPHANDRSPDRPLRVGLVSPDFRDHCQSFFTVPLLSHIDRRQFQVFCYSDVPGPDGLTARLRGLADMWRNTTEISDPRLAEIVREDRIDVLVDLTMHMANGRPLLFARKPAPVQVAWLAYPGTTGLKTMDYRLTDPYLDPPGETDAHYSERSVRLPDTFWCYEPLTAEPAPGPLPADAGGTVTFGCLNNFCKVNDAVLALWARVLAGVPGSRLLLLSPPGEHRRAIPDKLGLDPARVEFVGIRPRPEYLRHYRRIDIGLDTFPYNGHTTSLDALWMGVPVITRIGNTVVGRAGWSQLCNLGLTEFAATTDQRFVAIAAGLAGDLPRLRELRSTLRERMRQSPLMDAARFAANFQSALRGMWRAWCGERS